MLRGLRISLLSALMALLVPAGALAGDVDPPEITVTPTFIDFGDFTSGTSSPPENVLIENGPFSMALTVSLPSLTGMHPGDFAVTSDGCAPYPRNLMLGGSCSLAVTFSPSVVGTRLATLNIPSTDLSEPNTEVSLIGDGLPPPIADLTIAKAGGAVLGQDIYETTPDEQVLSGKLKRGRTRTYILNVGNDGEIAAIAVQGCASEKGFKVSYFDTGSDFTDDIVAGTYEAEVGSAGRDVEMVVKAKQSAHGTLRCPLTGSAPGSDDDAVQVKVKAKN